MVGTSRLLRDLITAVVDDEPGLEVVGELDSDALLGAGTPEVDCIVAASEGSAAELCRTYEPIIRRRPEVRVIGLVEGGRHSLVYELVPRCSMIGELSPEVLVRTIRRQQTDAHGAADGLC